MTTPITSRRSQDISLKRDFMRLILLVHSSTTDLFLIFPFSLTAEHFFCYSFMCSGFAYSYQIISVQSHTEVQGLIQFSPYTSFVAPSEFACGVMLLLCCHPYEHFRMWTRHTALKTHF